MLRYVRCPVAPLSPNIFFIMLPEIKLEITEKCSNWTAKIWRFHATLLKKHQLTNSPDSNSTNSSNVLFTFFFQNISKHMTAVASVFIGYQLWRLLILLNHNGYCCKEQNAEIRFKLFYTVSEILRFEILDISGTPCFEASDLSPFITGAAQQPLGRIIKPNAENIEGVCF